MFRASNDSGKTFADKIDLSQSPTANSFHSNVAASGKNVYVSLHDARSGNVDTYVRTSTDSGKTFGPLIKIKKVLEPCHKNQRYYQIRSL